MGTDEPLLVTVGEAAKLLGVSRTTCYRLALNGDIPVVRVRGAVRVNRRALVEWIEARTAA